MILCTGKFIGFDGKFYVVNPVSPKRVAVYCCKFAYDHQLHIPYYVDFDERLFKEIIL